MGGSIIFGSHNKQLAPFSLFEVGRRGGGTTEKAEETERGEAARAMLFYGSCHMDEGAARP